MNPRDAEVKQKRTTSLDQNSRSLVVSLDVKLLIKGQPRCLCSAGGKRIRLHRRRDGKQISRKE